MADPNNNHPNDNGNNNNSNKSSELNRSASIRTSARLSQSVGDDDNIDMMAMSMAMGMGMGMGISDGFRPRDVAQGHVSRPSTTSLEPPSIPHVTSQQRPSSISKPHSPPESLPLRNDGLSTENRHESGSMRGSRLSTTTPFMNTESPYEGPSGPSYPYQMYPQNVRPARTASLATTSTAPVSERSYNGPRGPTHPYGMYPQNIVSETESMPSQSAQRDINVGFLGNPDNYQRRIGPEGEDVADLIGPDGHTEQLPPYTRYPDEAYNRKAMGVETPQPQPAAATVQQQQPSLAIPGAGGIGLATRNPEFASTEDLGDLSGDNSPQSRRSLRSFTSDGSHHEINTAALEVTNEKKPLKNWQVAARRRVWGIVPCWAIVLAVVVLILMGVVLGAVIGTLFGPHIKPPPSDRPPAAATTMTSYDVTPLATVPPGLPPLAEGTFGLPTMNTRAPNTCFNDTTQAQSWNCNMVPSQLAILIKKVYGAPDVKSYAISFSYNSTYTLDDDVFSYGMQPPGVVDLPLRLVNDTLESSRGPAWEFAAFYNKTVIIPGPLLTPSTSASAASSSSDVSQASIESRMLYGGDYKRKGIAQPGDKPWVCYWGNTILETLIYAGQNSSFSHPINPFPSSSASPTSTENVASAAIVSPASATPTETGVQERGAYGKVLYPSGFPTTFPMEEFATTETITSLPSSTSTDYFNKSPTVPDEYPVYPRVIKMEERRTPDGATPFCRQYEIDDNETARPVKDEDGNFVEIVIAENEEDPDSEVSARGIIERYLGARSSDDYMSDCGCMWWLT
ncbi:hypothetical protein F4778DRAFT_541742 [Xylariomycetidae sp. FL2044]|nr:hypothetical protein F4778DRAFT_541742 [Xylariomycetidae sp. FL2044]